MKRFVAWADQHPLALWLRSCAVLIGLAILLVACGAASAPGAPRGALPSTQPALDYVTSACDEHGSLVYKASTPGQGAIGIAVAPNHPDCPQPPRSTP